MFVLFFSAGPFRAASSPPVSCKQASSFLARERNGPKDSFALPPGERVGRGEE